MTIINGDALVSDALSKLKINLIDLIAEVSVWVSPDFVKEHPEAIYPNRKRGPKAQKGQCIDGIYIDDNTYANSAIKRAIGKKIRFENFHVCHIWPESVYDERYYSLLPNLVLLPRIVAGLSDYYKEVIDVLKYRSFEIYGWYPQEAQEPQKPEYYPTNWNTENFSTTESDFTKELDGEEEQNEIDDDEYGEEKEAIEVDKVKRKVPKWFGKDQINSRILERFMELLKGGNAVLKIDLKEACGDINKFNSNFDQMKNFSRKNNAKVFEEIEGGYVILWPIVSTFIRTEYKKYLNSIKQETEG